MREQRRNNNHQIALARCHHMKHHLWILLGRQRFQMTASTGNLYRFRTCHYCPCSLAWQVNLGMVEIHHQQKAHPLQWLSWQSQSLSRFQDFSAMLQDSSRYLCSPCHLNGLRLRPCDPYHCSRQGCLSQPKARFHYFKWWRCNFNYIIELRS